MANKQLEWDVAEVLEYDYTYQHIPSTDANATTNKLFALRVRSCSGYFNNKPFLAKPSNINMKQIPLVGEFVLIYRTFNQESNGQGKWRESWYYVTSIDVQSSIHENMLPGLSDGVDNETIENVKPGKTFQRKHEISPLQPFEGDLLIEGRFGNSIRFGSTITTKYPANYYTKPPGWIGSKQDPIIILSNGRQNYPDKEFVVENINSDASSIYLTSTQNLDFKLSRQLSKYNSFAGSQVLVNSNRLILRANKDIAVIDSQKGIVLNTIGEVRIGNDKADQKMVHGNELYSVLDKLITALTLGCTDQGTPRYLEELATIQQQLPGILSNKYFIEKTSVPTL